MNDSEPEFAMTEREETAWRRYLAYFKETVYPMFQEHGVSLDAALTCWFVNRLRNAIPDRDGGNDIEDDWKRDV